MNKKQLGKILHKARIEKEYTRKEVAEMLKVTHDTVCKWESGKLTPRVGKLVKLEIILDTKILTDEFIEQVQ